MEIFHIQNGGLNETHTKKPPKIGGFWLFLRKLSYFLASFAAFKFAAWSIS